MYHFFDNFYNFPLINIKQSALGEEVAKINITIKIFVQIWNAPKSENLKVGLIEKWQMDAIFDIKTMLAHVLTLDNIDDEWYLKVAFSMHGAGN